MRALAEAPLPAPPVAGTQPVPSWRDPDERQAAARNFYLAVRARGGKITGEQLGDQFGMSARWGRDRIAEVRNGIPDGNTNPAGRQPLGNPTTGNGNRHRPAAPPVNGDGNGNGNGGHDHRAAPTADGNSNGNGNGNGNANGRRVAAADGSSGNESPASAVNGKPRPKVGGRQAAAVHTLPLDGSTATVADDHLPIPEAAPGEVPAALIAVTKIAVAVVAAVTMFTSYSHTRDLALLAGESSMVAGLLPAAVDGLVIAGSTSLLVDHQRHRHGSPLAWAAVVLGLASSMAANVVDVDPSIIDLRHVKWVMAAYAPLALGISGHLLVRMIGTDKDGGQR